MIARFAKRDQMPYRRTALEIGNDCMQIDLLYERPDIVRAFFCDMMRT